MLRKLRNKSGKKLRPSTDKRHRRRLQNLRLIGVRVGMRRVLYQHSSNARWHQDLLSDLGTLECLQRHSQTDMGLSWPGCSPLPTPSESIGFTASPPSSPRGSLCPLLESIAMSSMDSPPPTPWEGYTSEQMRICGSRILPREHSLCLSRCCATWEIPQRTPVTEALRFIIRALDTLEQEQEAASLILHLVRPTRPPE